MIKALFPLTAGATLALLVAVPPAVAALDAQPGAADAPMPDRGLTRAEATAQAERLFARLDVNHDGRIDAADRAARIGTAFDRIDTNHDGTISRDEFAAARYQRMMHDGWHHRHHHHHHHHHSDPARPGLPPHGDARVGPSPGTGTMPAPDGVHDMRGPGAMPPPDGVHDRRRPHGHDGPHGHGDHGGGRGRHGHGPHGEMALAGVILRMADPAHTGTVTRAAFIAAALALFDRADANHDGILTPAEHRAAWAGSHTDLHMGPHGHMLDRRDGAGRPGGAGDMPPPASSPPVHD